MKNTFLTFLFLYSLGSVQLFAQAPCIGDLEVIVQGTSNGLSEGLIVKQSGDDGTNSLRNVIRCAQDGDIIIYDQAGLIPTNSTVLVQQLNIDKSLTIMGLSIDDRPEISIDFTSLGLNPGIIIMKNKTVVLVNIDLKETNNTHGKEIIKVDDDGMLKVMGKTVITKN